MRISGKVFLACGLWLVALGIYFVLLRPALLPEDLRYVGIPSESLRAAAPGLERWLGHVFDVLGGFMIASGALTALTAWRLRGLRGVGAFLSLLVAGIAGVGLMSVTNFLLHSDFRWLLLLPAVLWAVGLACYLGEQRALPMKDPRQS